jgi:hypothetical protein
MDQKRVVDDTVGELLRLVGIMSVREVRQETMDTWKLAEYAVNFYLRFDRKLQLLLGRVLSQLDLSKVKLSIEDKTYCAPRKDYVFGFQENPTPEEKRVIDIAKLIENWDDEMEVTRNNSTKDHQTLSERHKKEQEGLASKTVPKTEEEAKVINAAIERVSMQFNEEMRRLQEEYEPQHKAFANQFITPEQIALYDRQLKERQELDSKYNAMLKESEEKYVAEKKKLDPQTQTS